MKQDSVYFAFTVEEGGKWHVLTAPESTVEQVENQLTESSIIDYLPATPIHLLNVDVCAHSVLLPDGRIWDSRHKKFFDSDWVFNRLGVNNEEELWHSILKRSFPQFVKDTPPVQSLSRTTSL